MIDGGRAAYRGFNYQIHVSVWLALDLVAAGALKTIEIEALGGEDAAVLTKRSDEDCSERSVSAKAGELVIQIKARERGHWTTGDVLNVLRGHEAEGDGSPASRVRPLTELTRHPAKRFLFVTTTQLADPVNDLKVEKPNFEPRDRRLEGGQQWEKTVTGEHARRIGVLEDAKLELVVNRTDSLLAHFFSVPKARRAACAKALRDRVEEGLLNQARSAISDEDIRLIAKDHGGVPAGPEVFVAPASLDRVKALLARHHAIVLLGPIGVGKTTAGRAIAHDYAKDAEPFMVVYPKSPSELQEASRLDDRAIVLVDDPFDPRLDPNRTREWAHAIHRFGPNTERKLIITSRKELLPQTARTRAQVDGALDYLHQHACTLEVTEYDGRELLRAHLQRAKVNRVDAEWLAAHEEAIVIALKKPLEFNAVVERASYVATTARNAKKVAEIIAEVSESTLTRDLERAFGDKDEPQLLGLSTVILALGTRDATREVLERLDADLRELRAEVVAAARTLHRFGWLEIGEDGKMWVNSVRLAAMERRLAERPSLRALAAETAILGAAHRHDVDLALALRKASRRWLRLRPSVSLALGETLHRWLVESARASVPEPESSERSTNDDDARNMRAQRFPQLLVQFAADAVPTDPLTPLARALVYKEAVETPDHFGTFGFPSWEPPSWDDHVRRRVMGSSEMADVVRAFVRHGLPSFPGMLSGADAFVDFLYGIVDLGPDFVDAVTKIEDASDFAAEALALGAARAESADLNALLTKALGIQAEAEARHKAAAAFVDDDSHQACEHLSEQYYEDTRAARALVDAVLGAYSSRRVVDWAKNAPSMTIIGRYSERVRSGEESNPRLIERVLRQLPGEGVASILIEAARRTELIELAIEMLERAPEDRWGEIAENLVGDTVADEAEEPALENRSSRMRLAMQMRVAALPPARRVIAVRSLLQRKRLAGWREGLMTELTPEERRTFDALSGGVAALDPATIELLRAIANGASAAAPDALRTLARLEQDVEPWLAWHEDADPHRARAALEAARTLGPARQAALLAKGLGHSHHEVRKAALRELAPLAQDAETTAAIAKLATDDPTTGVRCQALVSLAGNTSPIATMALVTALADPKDTSDDAQWGYQGFDEETMPSPEYGLALAAAAALADQRPLLPDLRQQVEAFLGSDKPTARDLSVRGYLDAALREG